MPKNQVFGQAGGGTAETGDPCFVSTWEELEKAVNTDGKTDIELIADIYLPEEDTNLENSEGEVVINGNGKTIYMKKSSKSTYLAEEGGCDFYLKNVTLDSSNNNDTFLDVYAGLTLDNVKFKGETGDFGYICANDTLTVLGAEAEGNEEDIFANISSFGCPTTIIIGETTHDVNLNVYVCDKTEIQYSDSYNNIKINGDAIKTDENNDYSLDETTKKITLKKTDDYYTISVDNNNPVDTSMNSYSSDDLSLNVAGGIKGGFCSINQNMDYAVIAADENYVISSIKLINTVDNSEQDITGNNKDKKACRWNIPSDLQGTYTLQVTFYRSFPITISQSDNCTLTVKKGDIELESGAAIGTDDIISISYGLKENVSDNYEAVLETKGLEKIADTENQYKATGTEDPAISVKSKIKDEYTVADPVIELIKDGDDRFFGITCSTLDAKIYYTTDGSDPTSTKLLYTTPISLETTKATTVKAIAVKEDWNNSEVATKTYKGKFYFTVESKDQNSNYTWSAKVNGVRDITGTGDGQISDVEEGDVVTFKPVANDGYRIYSVSASNSDSLTKNEDGTYTYVVKEQGEKIELKVYKKIAVEVVNQNTDAGTITTDWTEDYIGGRLNITATVNSGYKLQTLQYSKDDGTTWNTCKFSTSTYKYYISITEGENVTNDKLLIKPEFVESQAITTINSYEDFKTFAEQVSTGDNYYGQTVTLRCDVNFNNEEWKTIGSFAGAFDGGGHTISGLSITSADSVYKSGNYNYYGLFSEAVTIKNLTVKGKIDITHDTAGYIYAGGIAGEADSITGCRSYVDINIQSEPKHAYSYIGGITGSGTVSSCINFGDISLISKEYQNATTTGNPADGNIGGIVGAAKSKGTIANCKNYGDLKYKGNTIQNQNHAEVDGAGGRFGGIVGNSQIGTVINCVNKGNITGDMQRAGGIVGDTSFDYNSSVATIKNCYNTGNITSTGSNYNYSIRIRLGGIFGTSGFCVGNVDVSDCYSTGNVTANFTSDTAKLSIGEIHANEVDRNLYSTSDRGGTYTLSNVYEPSEIKNKTISDFTDGVYVEDTAGINGGYPILAWEATSSLPEDKYAVSFNVTAGDKSVDADNIKIFSDAAMTAEIDYKDGLKLGTYYYKVTKAGYLDAEGSFSVVVKPVTVDVAMQAKAVIKFNVTPVGASVTVTDGFGREVTPVNGEYYLAKDNIYTYSIYKEGYNGVTRELSVTKDSTITVALTEAVKTDNVITTASSTITVAGTYKLGDGFTGTIKVQTGDAVTIAGSGVGTNNIYRNIYIDCTSQVSNLTLQDIYISNDMGSANMINFRGTGNRLNFAGTSILDMNTGATGYAMIHVPDNTSLTVTGGTLYMYKREQGAGIGGNGGAKGSEGQTAETNGDITISNATILAKNSKQGALIGAGAQSGTQQPGNITIENSDLNLIAVSRSAAIGGSAGSTGASKGSYVTARNSRININVDYSGSAIGGGGYAGGNDADGGTLVVDGSSIRTFIDTNAVDLWNVSSAGVNGNKAITATIKNAAGNSMYLAQINTAEVSTKGTYTVKADNKTVYSGGLHQYRYINENLPKGSQKNIEYTIDNWTALNDDNLYVYLEGKTQDITVNGDKYKAEFNSLTKEFTVTKVIEAVKEVTVIKGDTVKVAVPVEVKADGTEATVTVTDKNVEEMLKQAKENKADEIIFTADETQIKETEKINITLDTKTVKSIAGDTTASITVNTPAGNLTFDQAALDKIAADAKGTTITITIEKVKLPDKGTLVLIGNNAQIYNLTVKSGKDEIKQFKGNVTVSLPIPDSLKGKNVIAVHIADGKLEIVKGKIIGDRYQFTATHFSQYALVDGDTVKIDETDEGTLEKVKSLTKELKLKAPTSLTSKKSVKVTAKVTKGSISEITDLGYKVKYKYYRSVKKASKYSLKKTKSTKTYTNTAGKKGQKYYYKVRVYVYDADGKIAASTTFGQCKYGYRTWRK